MQECNLEEPSRKDHAADCNEDRDGWNEDLINAISQKVGKLEKDPEKTRLVRIRLCLDEGADINAQDKNGDTVLHVAVKRSYRRIVEFCLEKKAKTDIPNHNGETAMKLAETLKNQEILRILKKPVVERREPQVCTPSRENDPISLADDPKASTSRDRNVGIQRKPAAVEDVSERIDSRKRPDLVRDENKAEKSRALKEDETYAAGATLTKSWPGIVYQLKHLAFTLHCALQLEDPYFFLATEMIAAEKLDDVVLLYKSSSGSQVGRFVQIKYTSNQSGTITPQQLLEPDGNFSLLTYFISWRKVKENPLFRNVGVRNMILCTNMSLNVEELEKNQIYCENAEEPDESFELKSRVKESAWYKLSVDSELNAKLYHELKLATSVVRRLANLIAKCIYEKKPMRLEMGNFRDYHRALARDVFNTKTRQFHDKFVKDEGLSEKVKRLRELFLSEFLNMAQPAEKKIFEESPWEEVNKRFQTLNFRKDFGNAPKSQTNSDPQNELPSELTDDCIDDEEISQFLEEFTLAVNQPNEDELNTIIADKIDAHSRFNLINTQLLDGTFQTKMFDWFVKKDKQGTRTEYFSYRVGEELFKDMNDTIGSLITVGVKSMYCERVKAHNIRFREEMQRVTAFLNANGPNSVSNRILELVAPKKTLLTALRVYDTLGKIPQYKKMDSFIFTDMDTLKLPRIQNIVMTTFGALHHPDLLIVDCGSTHAEEYSQKFWNPLREIMGRNDRKKVIIITQAGENSGAQIDFDHEVFHERSDEYSFCKLTDDSQKKLLKRPITEFQGRKSDTSFGELLGIDDLENLSADELKNLLEIIDFDVLVELICGDEIKIGSAIEDLREVGDYYIHRTIHRQIIIKDEIFEVPQMPDLLVISGADGELPRTSKLQMNSPANQDVTNVIILDGTKEEEQFRALCARYEERNIHWLDKKSGKYKWKQSQGSIGHLVPYRDVTANGDNKDLSGATYLSETQLLAHDEPLIISDTAGMGKSTLLAYLAWKIKEDNPNILVLWLDLVHHVTAFSEIKDKGKYNLWNADEAVQFFVNELVIHKTNFERKVVKTLIEKQRQAALIIDGFDEICPTHEGVVMDLLRGLLSHGIKKLLIATRPHTKKALEMELNAFSYEIKPFSADNQAAFLTKFWKNQLGLRDSAQRTEDRITKYAEALIEKLANSIDDRSNVFTGLPLQARLVAEIFGNHRQGQRGDFDSCMEFVWSKVNDPKFPGKLNLIYLYERFVEKKFDIFFNKTGGNMANEMLKECKTVFFKQFIHTHEKLALNAIFNEDQTRKLLASQRELPQNNTEVVEERTGIITQFIDGRPQFGHRTYAEYFAAKFISEILGKGALHESTMRILVADILLRRNYENVRAFLNWLLSEKHHHTFENRRQWEFHLNGCRYEREGTIFHVAAAEGNACIIKLFLDCFDKNSRDRETLIEVKDYSGSTAVHRAVDHLNLRDHNGWTPLHTASRRGQLEVAKCLLDKGADVNLRDRLSRTPLHLAVEYGHLEVAKCLLDKGADFNLRDNDHWSPLHFAVAHGHLEVAKCLLDKGADFNLRDNHGRSPLHLAVEYGHLEVAKCLLDKGADVNTQNSGGTTPLHSAIENGHLEAAKCLLDKGADVNTQNSGGTTPLHLAIHNGHLEAAKCLLDKGADLNLRDNDHWSPLHFAVAYGRLEVAKCLLDKGADVNPTNEFGRTPLHLAVENGHLEVAKCLLDKGADVNLRDRFSRTPLHLAIYNGHLEAAKCLLDKGADLNLRDNNGRSPLHLAVENGHLEVAKCLLDKGADVNLRDRFSRTPLHLAVRNGHLEVAKCLLDKGADVNTQNSGGTTPLHLAIHNGHLEAAKCLLDKGADVNPTNEFGRTPLHLAVENGHLEVAKCLLDKGADVNTQNSGGTTPLHLAIHNGHLEAAKCLLDKGADVNPTNEFGRTPLHLAVENGHLEVAKCLLDKGADVNTQNSGGTTPLHLAIHNGHLEAAKCLLDKGADVNPTNEFGRTPLHLAVENGHLEVAKCLLDKGADVNTQNSGGTTPLHLAIYNGHLEAAKCLLDKGADVNPTNEFGRTPLHLAVENGHLEVAKCLLDKGADVNTQNSGGTTPLHLAIHNGHLEAAKCLLDKGADLNLRDNDHWSPLHFAVAYGRLEVAKCLLDKGADVNPTNEFGRTPLHLAVENGHLEVAKCLLDKGADVNTQNSGGTTPLHLAIYNGHLEAAKCLLDKGADLNLRDNNGRSPLHLAVENGHLEVAKCLLDKGADVNLRDRFSRTPLHLAVRNGHLEVAKCLLDKGADVNTQNSGGTTPLHLAIHNGHLEAAKCLLDKGADVNPTNEFGRTPLHLAVENGHLEVAKCLLDKGADVNTQNSGGTTPLHLAIYNGHLEAAKCLLDKGADFNLRDNDHWSPLHFAVAYGHLEVAKCLLDKGADFNLRDNDHWSPLHFAVAHGHLEVAKCLLDKGADFNLRDNHGRSPLHLAVEYGHLEVAKCLRQAGGNVGPPWPCNFC